VVKSFSTSMKSSVSASSDAVARGGAIHVGIGGAGDASGHAELAGEPHGIRVLAAGLGEVVENDDHFVAHRGAGVEHGLSFLLAGHGDRRATDGGRSEGRFLARNGAARPAVARQGKPETTIMRPLVLLAATLSLTAAPLAQGLPSLDGDGHSAQSVELLGGAVSVGVEMSGGIDTTGPAPAASGSVGLGVNGAGIGLSATTPRTPSAGANGAAALPSGIEDDACSRPVAVPDDLTQALAAPMPLELVSDCGSPSLDFAQAMAEISWLTNALQQDGIALERVVSITILEDRARIAYAVSR
jgi:hypothetical protein